MSTVSFPISKTRSEKFYMVQFLQDNIKKEKTKTKILHSPLQFTISQVFTSIYSHHSSDLQVVCLPVRFRNWFHFSFTSSACFTSIIFIGLYNNSFGSLHSFIISQFSFQYLDANLYLWTFFYVLKWGSWIQYLAFWLRTSIKTPSYQTYQSLNNHLTELIQTFQNIKLYSSTTSNTKIIQIHQQSNYFSFHVFTIKSIPSSELHGFCITFAQTWWSFIWVRNIGIPNVTVHLVHVCTTYHLSLTIAVMRKILFVMEMVWRRSKSRFSSGQIEYNTTSDTSEGTSTVATISNIKKATGLKFDCYPIPYRDTVCKPVGEWIQKTALAKSRIDLSPISENGIDSRFFIGYQLLLDRDRDLHLLCRGPRRWNNSPFPRAYRDAYDFESD
jgi:hypothetical protein